MKQNGRIKHKEINDMLDSTIILGLTINLTHKKGARFQDGGTHKVWI